RPPPRTVKEASEISSRLARPLAPGVARPAAGGPGPLGRPLPVAGARGRDPPAAAAVGTVSAARRVRPRARRFRPVGRWRGPGQPVGVRPAGGPLGAHPRGRGSGPVVPPAPRPPPPLPPGGGPAPPPPAPPPPPP